MERITAMADSVKSAVNPFTRLVNAATENDGSTGISYYQSEQVKEASHQSDYACEWVHKALLSRLDAVSPLVQYKSLWLIRLLLLEGPATFAEKMGGHSTGQSIARIHFLSTQAYPDPFKNSIEESVKNLASAIHASITGAGQAVLNNLHNVIGVSSAHSNNSHSSSTGGAAGGPSTQGKFKSAFQQEQVKELRNWKKRRDEERSSGTIIQDKNLVTFNGQLTAAKLIESVLQAEKKKFAPEEVFSFVEAAVANAKTVDVCALMEKVIAEPRYNIAQRHKMLQMVEGLVMTQGTNESNGTLNDIGAWWQSRSAGNLAKCTACEDLANPAKAKQIQEIARRILEFLNGGFENVSPSVNGPAAAATTTVANHSTAMFSSSNNNNAGNNMSFGSTFSNNNAPVPAPIQQQQQQQSVVSSNPPSTNTSQNRSRGASIANNNNMQKVGGSSSANTTGTGWQPTFGMTNVNPIFAMDNNINNSNQGGDMFGGLAVKKSTSTVAHPHVQQQQQHPQPVVQADIFASVPTQNQNIVASAPSADDLVKQLQEQFQKNMAMMAALQNQGNQNTQPQHQQQQRPPVAPPVQQQQPGAWGSTLFAPPPIPEVAVVPQQQQTHHEEQRIEKSISPEVQHHNDNEHEHEQAVIPPLVPIAPINVYENENYHNGNSHSNQSNLISPVANSSMSSTSTSHVPSVPNNSFVDPSMNMAAMQAQMQQVQMLITAQQQQQQQQQQNNNNTNGARSRSDSINVISANHQQQQHVHVRETDTPRSDTQRSVRSAQDAELISLLQQQLASAQQQIAQQNQMMQMMQQQIQMLMTAAQQK